MTTILIMERKLLDRLADALGTGVEVESAREALKQFYAANLKVIDRVLHGVVG